MSFSPVCWVRNDPMLARPPEVCARNDQLSAGHGHGSEQKSIGVRSLRMLSHYKQRAAPASIGRRGNHGHLLREHCIRSSVSERKATAGAVRGRCGEKNSATSICVRTRPTMEPGAKNVPSIGWKPGSILRPVNYCAGHSICALHFALESLFHLTSR
jgi:hypothetical protein